MRAVGVAREQELGLGVPAACSASVRAQSL